MADQERKDQQSFETPEQKTPRIDDLSQPEVSKDQANQTKGGVVFGATEDGNDISEL
jgi:hypothetical protein